MPHLSPQTLTHGEQKAILRATARNRRDHLICSLALGTGLRLGEIVGLNVEDVYARNRRPRKRIWPQPDSAKNGRAGDVFLPDASAGKKRSLARPSARHASSLTTTVYTHPSDQELFNRVLDLQC